jgi:hypothetical protein
MEKAQKPKNEALISTNAKRKARRTVAPKPIPYHPTALGANLWAKTIELIAPWRCWEYPGYLAIMVSITGAKLSSVSKYAYAGTHGPSTYIADRIIAYLQARLARTIALIDEWSCYRDRQALLEEERRASLRRGRGIKK